MRIDLGRRPTLAITKGVLGRHGVRSILVLVVILLIWLNILCPRSQLAFWPWLALLLVDSRGASAALTGGALR